MTIFQMSLELALVWPCKNGELWRTGRTGKRVEKCSLTLKRLEGHFDPAVVFLKLCFLERWCRPDFL